MATHLRDGEIDRELPYFTHVLRWAQQEGLRGIAQYEEQREGYEHEVLQHLTPAEANAIRDECEKRVRLAYRELAEGVARAFEVFAIRCEEGRRKRRQQ